MLARQTLSEYVATRPRRSSAPASVVMIFDQFEEVLTVDPLAVDALRQLFDQLGSLLRDPRIWALFVLREDYLAQLDPFAHQVPTQLKNRFRIDLLSRQAAQEAIVEPARRGGREFPAAAKLIADLARRKVQQPDGSWDVQAGHHVEPVQLQVVCWRLWNALPEDRWSIEPADLERFGDVNLALSAYYAESVARIAAGDASVERAVRDWFDDRLITAGGVRQQVLRGAQESGGLANELIARLLDSHLVRAEKRAGATWYELAHDRLIEVVQDDNLGWRQQHLSKVQHQAALWQREGRPAGLLLAGDQLAAAERWSAGSVVITEVELSFLEESAKAQAIAVRTRRHVRWIKRLGLVAATVSVLALGASIFAVTKMVEARDQRARAEQQRELAESQRLEAELQREEAVRQRRNAETQTRRAELERQAADVAREEAEEQRQIAQQSEREARAQKLIAEDNERETRAQKAIAEENQREAEQQRQIAERNEQDAEEQRRRAERLRRVSEARELALKTQQLPEGSDPALAALLAREAYQLNVANGGDPDDPDVFAALWQAAKRLAPQRSDVLRHSRDEVRALALFGDGSRLITGGEDGKIYLVDLGPGSGPRQLARELAGLEGRVRSVATDPAGRWIAAGTLAGTIGLWDLESGDPPRTLAGHAQSVTGLAFRPGNPTLASASADGELRLWDLEAADGEVRRLAEAGSGALHGLAFRGDGDVLAAAGSGGLRLWNLKTEVGEARTLGTGRHLRSVAWSDDGGYLASGTKGGTILLWDLSRDGGPEALDLAGHTAAVEAVAFNPARAQLASASLDGSVRLWAFKNPEARPIVMRDHNTWVWSVGFHPDGDHGFSGGSDQMVRRWKTHSALLVGEICNLAGRNLSAEEWREYLPPDLDYRATCLQPIEAGS